LCSSCQIWGCLFREQAFRMWPQGRWRSYKLWVNSLNYVRDCIYQ
jgi:hypothetical protein